MKRKDKTIASLNDSQAETPRAPTKKRVRPLLVNTGLVLLSVTLAMAAFDLTVYLLPKDSLPGALRDVVQQMEISRGTQYIDHPELGFTINPASDFVFPGSEFRFRFHTPLDYPDAGFRGGTRGGPIWGAAFGDSFTFGAGVELGATWVARLAELTQREIVNFGVPGHGPYQYTKIFQKFGAPLRPKIVFYALFTNDLKDARRFAGVHTSKSAGLSIKRFLKFHSVSHNVFRNLGSVIRRKPKDATWHGVGVTLVNRRLRDPYSIPDEEFAPSWEAVTVQIEQAAKAAEAIGATFVLLYFPSKEEVYWELAKDKLKATPGFAERIDRLRNTALQYCQTRQLWCLDLTPSLKARGLAGEPLYFPLDIHWNEKGNSLVAQGIHRFLVEKKLLP